MKRTKIKVIPSCELYKIKLPAEFRKHPPKPEKIIHKMLKFSRESELDDILVDENFYLLDGYCSYLIAQQVGIGFVTIKQIRSGGRGKA